MHTIHLLAYKYDGDGLKACEVLSEILFMLAQVGPDWETLAIPSDAR